MNQYRTHANVYLDRIIRNIERTKKIISSGTKIMAIVKADAYGHGALPVAKALEPIVDAYGVATIEEAVDLRINSIQKPILILGFTPEGSAADVVKYDVTTAVYNLEMAQWIAKEAVKQGKVAKLHIKIDTGMGRIGFALTDESVEVIKQIAELDGIEVNGCFSHFSKADEADLSYAKEQLKKYDAFVAKVEQAGVLLKVKHISNSAGIMMLPEANKYMVRSGISTYGYYPSEEVDKNRLLLEPAMEWKAHISYVKTVGAGVSVSYGGTYVTEQETTIATVPVGYADGYPRTLSNKGYVLVHGEKAPIIGRVCMDQFMIDVSHIEGVRMGDEVTLIGEDKGAIISVEEIANLAGSFNYEFVCDVHKRVPRVYYKDGKQIGQLFTKDVVEIKSEIN